MKIPPSPHGWSVTPRRAIAIQKELAARIRVRSPRGPLRRIAGVDAAFSADGEFCIAGVVVWDRFSRRVVERRTARRRLRFPYIPGLLSFREAPAILAALRKLSIEPDLLMCDGHGLAHLRRFGIACHVGLVAALPAMGCAKSRLVGEHLQPGPERGSRSPLMHRGEVIGAALRTRDSVKPVYVSVGHDSDLPTAIRVALQCSIGYRLPEPVRLADRFVADAKRVGLYS
jgi:deoxyribonuclease V